MALLDGGAQVNTITPRYLGECSLWVGPVADLVGSRVTCVGLGGTCTGPLGCVVVQVWVDRVWGYGRDQVALVILDHSGFATGVPIILGTPTIGRVVSVVREVEMDALAVPWVNARVAHLLAVGGVMLVGVGNDWEGEYGTDRDGPLVYTGQGMSGGAC